MSVELKNISFAYQNGTPLAVDALYDVSLKISDGEFVGIMGRTGCGKSTLLQLIAGLERPTGGTVLIDGEDINAKGFDKTALRKKVGVVLQYPETQLFETTVRRDVGFGLKYLNLTRDEQAQRVRDALKLVGFDYDAVKDSSPMAFSGGERRRIAIAGVLAQRPKLLLLDEPAAGLSPQGRDEFLRLINTLNAQGVTVMLVSHSADDIAENARRVLVLQNGRLALDGTPREAFADIPRLEAMGAAPSEARRLMQLLNSRGMDMPPAATYGEALSAILKAVKGGDAHE